MFRNYRFKNYNFRLVIFIVALTIYGIIIIGSANKSYQNKQIIGMVIGIIVMVAVSMVDYSAFLSMHWLFYILSCLMLLLVFVPGLSHSSKGARRWAKLGPLQFQPSELAKIFIVMFLAWYLMKYQEDLNKKKRLLTTIAFCLVPLGLIVLEPDLSTTIVVFCIIFSMLFYAGLSKKIVGAVLGLIAAGAFGVIFLTLHAGGVLAGYQNDRIAAWLQPDKYPSKSMQQQNSIMAIGSGELFGKGLANTGANSVKNGNYIPEPHTDFIFAVTGEETGFLGTVLMIVLLFLIVFECLRTAKKAKDLAGQLICIGMASTIGFQTFVNICVVTGLMPNTGLTLPFVSYGLTSLVTLYFGMGFVLNVSVQSKKFYADERNFTLDLQ
ncbi:MAG: rod shape-determining protein RodA [Lachnospiraceae bacterium]|uniref:Rod shape-determining protein RodA n=1 Tax=Candidatus Weimeria bifida TaxID=2599074 RepID=A0A6N7IWG5_9FIRM|nr:rod shape-determining protein RodA [Candidatus Weimeria bifida]RRF96038.1 MAG: rod shape-determining protein RodA [Lachnospiraceae bacterium]